MTLSVAIVLFIILALVITLYVNVVKPGIAFLGAIVVLLMADGVLETIWGEQAQILTPKQALDGFANEQLAIIVILLVLGNVFRKSSAVNDLFGRFLKKSDSPRLFLFKLMSSVGLSSAVFNNTPLVAMMMPYVYNWSKENKLSPSKFLIPLSFASILGGCITVIGTSTLLIVSGLAEAEGLEPLHLFDVTPVGAVMFVIGVLFLMIAQRWLPGKKLLSGDSTTGQDNGADRQFFFETIVNTDASIIGKTVREAGLRNMNGIFLVEIFRNEKPIRPVGPNQVLQSGDILFFAGDMKRIEELSLDKLGLSLPTACKISEGQKNDISEVVVSHRSSLSGIEIRDTNFRSKFDAAVLAMHRNGERVWGHLGRIRLKPGDVLLLITGKDFRKRIENNADFYLISNIQKEKEVNAKKVFGLLSGMLLAIFLTAINVVSLFKSLLFLLILTMVTKITTNKDIRSAIDLNLILIIGLGLALGQAMVNSGTAALLSGLIVSLASGGGTVMLLTVIFLATAFLASIITSKAAVAVIFPVSVYLAQSIGVDVLPFILVVAFAGAANFITPIGYQTNLMVYGPGGYTFKDFFKIGFPLTVIYMVVTITILSITYNLY